MKSLRFMDSHSISHKNEELCSSCITQFVQPTKTPNADSGLDPIQSPYRRLGRDVLTSAHAGCQLCTIVWSRLTSLLRRKVERIEDVMISPNLSWDENANEYCGLVYWAKVGSGRTGSVYPELLNISINPESGKSKLNYSYHMC